MRQNRNGRSVVEFNGMQFSGNPTALAILEDAMEGDERPRGRRQWKGEGEEKGKENGNHGGHKPKQRLFTPRHSEIPEVALLEPAPEPRQIQEEPAVNVIANEKKEKKREEATMKNVNAQTDGTVQASIAPQPKATNDLPDLSQIVVKPLTEAERTKAELEIKARREFAEGAGERLAVIIREIAEIESDPEKLELSPTLRNRLADLKAMRAQLTVEDEGLRKHTEFSTFIASIRAARPEEANEYIEKALEMKRIEVTTETTGANLLFNNGKAYKPCPDSTGKVTSGAVVLVNELRKLVNAAKTAHQEALKNKVADIKAKGTVTCVQLLTAVPHPKGFVYILTQDDAKHETSILLECDGVTIRPIDGIGWLQNFVTNLKEKKLFVTVRELREGKLMRNPPLSQDTFNLTVNFRRMIQNAADKEKSQTKATTSSVEAPPAVQTATPPPAPPKKPNTRTKKATAKAT